MKRWPFEVFYDGECPLCMKEIRLLRWLDRNRSNILFTDIAAPDFDPLDYGGYTMDVFMAEIHGRKPDGTMVTGVEVFRQLYGAVGLGWIFAPTKWPIIRPIADYFYTVFARNRLRLTGRCTPELGCEVTPQSAATD